MSRAYLHVCCSESCRIQMRADDVLELEQPTKLLGEAVVDARGDIHEYVLDVNAHNHAKGRLFERVFLCDESKIDRL